METACHTDSARFDAEFYPVFPEDEQLKVCLRGVNLKPLIAYCLPHHMGFKLLPSFVCCSFEQKTGQPIGLMPVS